MPTGPIDGFTPAPELQVGVRPANDGVELSVAGEVDEVNASMLTEAFAAVQASAQGTVYVDLAAVRYMDSCGLRVLLTQKHRFEQAGRLLIVTSASRQLRRLFDLVGLADVLGPVATN